MRKFVEYLLTAGSPGEVDVYGLATTVADVCKQLQDLSKKVDSLKVLGSKNDVCPRLDNMSARLDSLESVKQVSGAHQLQVSDSGIY